MMLGNFKNYLYFAVPLIGEVLYILYKTIQVDTLSYKTKTANKASVQKNGLW
jgi:hypothetical protein